MSNTALGFPFGFFTNDNQPQDAKYFNRVTKLPYTDIAEATDLVLMPIGIRYRGLTINIAGVEYWWEKGTADEDLVIKKVEFPSTLNLFATTAPSDVVGYNVLVRNITDPRYNTVAVDVTTPVITGAGIPCGTLITDANIISGNPGVFNFTTIGNIRRTSGSGEALFYFRIYKRSLDNSETLIVQSDNTLPVIDSGTYVEFNAVALWNDGIFLDTDRIVLKFYADRISGGSNPTYQFQFGGTSPVRSTAAVPVAVLPNIYLKDLADVENIAPIDGEVLYWNEADSLWEHSSVEDLLPEFTVGSIIFSDGTTITQDNAQLFWDNTNNRLGLGTNTPTAKLSVITPGALITDISFRIRNNLNTLDVIRVDGLGDVYIGEGAGRVNTGEQNFFAGTSAGYNNTTAYQNTFIGKGAGFTNVLGVANTFIGLHAGYFNNRVIGLTDSGCNNTFIGRTAGYNNTTGQSQTFIGANAGQRNTTGSSNTYIGTNAGNANITGIRNVKIGSNTALTITSGSQNVILGSGAGEKISDGITDCTNIENSVFIGRVVKPLGDSQTNQIVIGFAATGLGSNTTVLGNSSIITTAIYGNLLLGKTSDVGGKLQIVGETQTGTSGIGILNLEQTWDTLGSPTAIKLNITNTASNTVAKLMDLQVGGVSRFYVDRLGNGRFSDGGTGSIGFGYGGGTSVSLNGTNLARTSAGGVDIGGNFSYINFITNNASAMIIHTSTKDVSINTTLDIGAKFQVVGKSMLNGTRFFGQPVPEALIASTTLSENQITKGIITVTNTVLTSFVLPSGTGLDGNLFAFSLMSVDTGLDYTFINLGTAIATITSGTDNPLVGNGIVNVGDSATFRSVKRATNVFVTYRIS